MRKLLHRLIVFTIAVTIPLHGVSAEEHTIAERVISGRKEDNLADSKTIQVALPESAKVTTAAGDSYTGKLTSLSPDNLVLSASGQSLTIPRSQISIIELHGAVWIPNPSGDIEPYIIRGLSIPIDNVPTTALTWNGSSYLATLNLQEVLTDGEFAKLTENHELVYALIRMVPNASDLDSMNLRIRSLGR